MSGPEHTAGWTVVLVRPEDETVVFAGELEDCEDWLALNGDTWEDGHLEIRPAGVPES